MNVSNFRNGGKLKFRGGNSTWGNFIQKRGKITIWLGEWMITAKYFISSNKPNLKVLTPLEQLHREAVERAQASGNPTDPKGELEIKKNLCILT